MPRSDTPFILQLPLRAARGALLGALLGVAFLALGLLRYCAAGGPADQGPTGDDRRVFAFYVGGFALAGAVADVVQPLLPGKAGTYVRFALAGAVVVLMIAVGDKGSVEALDGGDWVAMPLLGAAFGCAFARGLTRDTGLPGSGEPPAP